MRVVILGAGFGGIAAARSLRRAGVEDLSVLERGDGVGGTWRVNTYPGAACDVMSHLYSYSFHLKKDWTRTYATQPEILDYLETYAAESGLDRLVRFGTEVDGLRWMESTRSWQIDTGDGEVIEADAVVCALGMLEVPRLPDIDGRESFAGPAFHTARWDHGVDLAGRRVGVIGTGASAIQVVPAIAESVARLSLFQRSPTWVLPKLDRPYTAEEVQRFRRIPFATRRHRWELYWQYERNTTFRETDPATAGRERFARRWLDKSVADPDLRAALTPDYPIGCKRLLPSNDFYPAVQRDNVDLVTAPIERICERGVVTADGVVHELDALVYATGFRAAEFLSRLAVFGRGGRSLHDEWAARGGPEAHLGMTVAGFPNFFVMYGPNTNQGGNSQLFILEAQARYIGQAVRAMRRRQIATLEVRPDVMDAYNAEVRRSLDGTVWNGGCSSYFTNDGGKITTQLPHPSRWYWRRTRRFRLADHDWTAA